MFEAISNALKQAAIVPVVKVCDKNDALSLADALVAGGINAIEVTFRTVEGETGYSEIADCIQAVKAAQPEMLVGAGTVINPELAERAVNAGAMFVVSPGFNPNTVDWCIARNVPVYPGVNNPSQVEMALSKGLSVLKFFPAEVSGGIQMLKALEGPFPTVRFLATGGINAQNVSSYMRCRNVLAVGGSWMASEKLVAEKNWSRVTKLSCEALALF